MTQDAFIFGTGRSPFGRLGGSLATLRPDDLLAQTIHSVVTSAPFDLCEYEDVVIGNTNQAGEDCRNVARFSALLAGLPESTAGITVNRLCGSGLAAVMDAARCVQSNQGELFIAGGVESMSRAPLVLSKSLQAYDRQQTLADSTLGARFTNKKIEHEFGSDTMPQTADNVAHELDISRRECDEFAAKSQQKYQLAKQANFFQQEIVSVIAPTRKRGETVEIEEDEHPRPNTDLTKLENLKPLSSEGVVTAGNASGLNDGAATLIVGSRSIGERYSIAPKARIVSAAVAGVAPRLMGLGPVPASLKALERANLSLSDMDVIELNEAFAAQALGCIKQLKLSPDDSRINPNGGAIAIGHPLGASGARLVLTSISQLEAINGRYALVTMCIGLGQGIALVIERVH